MLRAVTLLATEASPPEAGDRAGGLFGYRRAQRKKDAPSTHDREVRVTEITEAVLQFGEGVVTPSTRIVPFATSEAPSNSVTSFPGSPRTPTKM
jgi:hypothetical protein